MPEIELAVMKEMYVQMDFIQTGFFHIGMYELKIM